MKWLRGLRRCSVLALVMVCGCSGASNPAAEQAAEAAAMTWLEQVDNGAYAESWKQAAGFFKGVVSSEKWIQAMQSARAPLGKKLSRNLSSARYRTALPGAPDGEYVVIQFKSSFENKKSAIETVTPMLDTDTVWRVSGYYIK